MPYVPRKRLQRKLERKTHDHRCRQKRNSTKSRYQTKRRIRHKNLNMDIHKHDNKLCNRMEGTVTVAHPGSKTPSEAEVKKHLAEHLKIGEDVLAIKNILTDFGGGVAKV